MIYLHRVNSCLLGWVFGNNHPCKILPIWKRTPYRLVYHVIAVPSETVPSPFSPRMVESCQCKAEIMKNTTGSYNYHFTDRGIYICFNWLIWPKIFPKNKRHPYGWTSQQFGDARIVRWSRKAIIRQMARKDGILVKRFWSSVNASLTLER
jgi:hypothetical protein